MQAIDREVLFKTLNEGILSERLALFHINLNKNRPLIERYGGLGRIVPLVQGRHVIVVGAGPSLEDNLLLLKTARQRSDIVIIAVDMALRPLLKSGIVPDFVISCETTPVDFFGGVSTDGMHLLAFSCMRNSTLRRWRGDVSFYNWMLHTPEYNELWQKAGTDLGFVATGNSVTTQAVALALGCGIRSLMISGNDLAFRCRMYIRGSVPLARAEMVCGRFNPLSGYEMSLSRRRREYEIHRGKEKYYTDNQFLAAKLWLEDLLKGQQVPVYDCSSPGCANQVVEHVPLEKYLDVLARAKRTHRR